MTNNNTQAAQEEKKIHRVAVLTSGGDAPGMNATIRSVVRTGANYGIKMLGIRRGYNGLINNDVVELDARSVNGLNSKGGTMLYTARCDEFRTPEGVKRAAMNCKYLGIDGIICIGGDGTFRGARELAEYGISVIGIPATIDNDIACTHYSIGFDTAANTAIDAIDKLSDTMQSHERCSIVEIMGRHAGHLSLYVGLAVGAAAIIIPEKSFDFQQDIVNKMRSDRIAGKNHFLVIAAEGAGVTDVLSERIKEETGVDTRVSILGHIQRGGKPSARDRVMGNRMGHYAVKCIMEGKTNRVVVYRDSKIMDFDMEEAFAMEKNIEPYMYEVATSINI